MQTRFKSGITKPLTFLANKHPLLIALIGCNEPVEPIYFIEANKHAERCHAMSEEYNALIQNGTWTLVLKHPVHEHRRMGFSHKKERQITLLTASKHDWSQRLSPTRRFGL